MSGTLVGGEVALRLVVVSSTAASATSAAATTETSSASAVSGAASGSSTVSAAAIAPSPDTCHLLSGLGAGGFWGCSDSGDSNTVRFVAIENFVSMVQYGLVSIFIKLSSGYGISDWNWQLLP